MQGELGLAQQQDARAKQLFDLSLPGLKTATNHYEDLASGDSSAIFKAVAPGVQATSKQFDTAKQNISDTMPRGGERNLAMEETDISKAGAVGNQINQAYEGSFNALASIAGKTAGLSVNEIANAISAFGGASNTASNIASQEEEGKAAMLGMIGSLGGSAAELGGSFA